MHAEIIKNARILIVDDQESDIRFLTDVLEPVGYTQVKTTTDPRDVPELYQEFRPDLILMDMLMPHRDGIEVMNRLLPTLPTGTYLPILILTSDPTTEAKRRALSGGAKDFLSKPFSPVEVRLRIRNLLETRFLHLELQRHNDLLEDRVGERTRDLEDARLEILDRLARAAEYRDDQTGHHTERVGDLSTRIARALDLPAAEIDVIRQAAPLHDIGKIGVPDHILLKEGTLTAEEFDVMKRHTTIGGMILSGSRFPLLQMAEQIALTHHERWDGAGYPSGLSGDDIPLAGRIVAIADVFDSLTHQRIYKDAWSPEDAVTEINRQSGRQFDPDLVDAFVGLEMENDFVISEPPEPVSTGRGALPVTNATPSIDVIERTRRNRGVATPPFEIVRFPGGPIRAHATGVKSAMNGRASNRQLELPFSGNGKPLVPADSA